VFLLNPQAFALASAPALGGAVTLFLCVDRGEAHVLCMCLWADTDAAERDGMLSALHVWHQAAMGAHGPPLTYATECEPG
jgi:hypothetical protein